MQTLLSTVSRVVCSGCLSLPACPQSVCASSGRMQHSSVPWLQIPFHFRGFGLALDFRAVLAVCMYLPLNTACVRPLDAVVSNIIRLGIIYCRCGLGATPPLPILPLSLLSPYSATRSLPSVAVQTPKRAVLRPPPVLGLHWASVVKLGRNASCLVRIALRVAL